MNCIACNKLLLFKHTFSLVNNQKRWCCESIGIFRDTSNEHKTLQR